MSYAEQTEFYYTVITLCVPDVFVLFFLSCPLELLSHYSVRSTWLETKRLKVPVAGSEEGGFRLWSCWSFCAEVALWFCVCLLSRFGLLEV